MSMEYTAEYTAAILCGGKSTRMGRDKATMRVGEERLADRLIREFLPCGEVLLSVRDEAQGRELFADGNSAGKEGSSEITAGNPNPAKLRFVEDEIREAGPLAGIAACLRESRQELLFVTAVDMPYMDRQFAEELLALGSKEEQPWDALLPVDAEGRLQGLCGFYRKTALPAVQESLAAGEHKVRAALEKLNVKTVEVNRITEGEKKIRNWNRVEDVGE